MADQQQLDILRQGANIWNKWRQENPDERLDLQGADLSRANLKDANFIQANLSTANLNGAYLIGAYLIWADPNGANLNGAHLNGANLSGADLIQANLRGADLTEANLKAVDLRGADLSRSNLTRASLVETNLAYAILTSCRVYGISAWKLQLKDTLQSNLLITDDDEPIITVDNLEVAQFIYLLLNNEHIRYVINTITSKVVLILEAVWKGFRGQLTRKKTSGAP